MASNHLMCHIFVIHIYSDIFGIEMLLTLFFFSEKTCNIRMSSSKARHCASCANSKSLNCSSRSCLPYALASSTSTATCAATPSWPYSQFTRISLFSCLTRPKSSPIFSVRFDVVVVLYRSILFSSVVLLTNLQLFLFRARTRHVVQAQRVHDAHTR